MGIPDTKNKCGGSGCDEFEVEKRISPLRCAPVEMTIPCWAKVFGAAAYS
jgi:hypothetical protein